MIFNQSLNARFGEFVIIDLTVHGEHFHVRPQIESALTTLDEKYRIVFLLRDIEGLSVRETAESLELTEATVKVRLLRVRLMMREQLTRAFGDESTRLFPDHEHS